MTGFARAQRSSAEGDLVLSLKSVNHRGLDIHFHLPTVLEAFEPLARVAIKKEIQRGHVQVSVSWSRNGNSGTGALNQEMLRTWLAGFREAARELGSNATPDPHDALRVAGMLRSDTATEWTPTIERDLIECLSTALAALNEFRTREGEELEREVRERVRQVEASAAQMNQIRSTARQIFHHRLEEKLRELLRGHSIDPQRLVQEAAILADRSDITEEVMRLETHARQIHALLDASGEKGKKLDFLLQEMNRETNTILSKTSGLGDHGLMLTDLALSAKAEIDKMREQALNLE